PPASTTCKPHSSRGGGRPELGPSRLRDHYSICVISMVVSVMVSVMTRPLRFERLGMSGSASVESTEQVWQAPGLREFRLAESQQILPVIGNQKPASERTHWMQPVPCSSRRRSCPGGERGDRQSSVPADSTPSGASPPGRRKGGTDC